MRLLAFVLSVLTVSACKSRESDESSLASDVDFDAGVLNSMTAIPDQNISDRYLQAFIFNAERATTDTASLAEAISDDMKCVRQKNALLSLFFLEVDNPRGLLTSQSSMAIERAQALALLDQLNEKYKLQYPSLVRHETADRFILIAKNQSKALTSPNQIELDEFAKSLAAVNDEDIDDRGTRIPLTVNCPDKREHAARLFNLQLRFPGVVNGSYNKVSGFAPAVKNIQLIYSDLKKN